MKAIDNFISASLKQREETNSLRSLKTENSLIDFCSNDYLGFSKSDKLLQLFEAELKKHPRYKLGSTGSRLLAGNDKFTEDLEADIAKFHHAEASLLFNSGYDANIGIFSSLPQRGDTIICDEYIHASIIDGARLSHANRFTFKHNDLKSLEQKLKLAKGRIYIGVESIYSMDGDEAPLKEICDLAERFEAAVIVDEAHAIGIFGDLGRGLVDELGLSSKIFARIITFGKALGTHGAAVLGSSELRLFMINYSRSFIYTTAASFLSHLAIKASYKYLKSANHQQGLNERINIFKSHIAQDKKLIESRSGIQALLVPGNVRAKEIAFEIQKAGYDVRAILSPSVPEGAERLRICLHSYNSISEIKDLCQYINKLL